MGLLDKLFGGKSKAAESSQAIAVDCPHAVLVPRWDSVQDMGQEDKATRFMCESCHQEFSPEEATKIRDSIAERLDFVREEDAQESGEQDR